MASPRGINSPPSVKRRRNTLRKSQVKNFTTVYNMALLFILGRVVTVLVRHGVGWGGRCPAVVCFLGCLGPHLHPWVTHLPTSCSSCSSASGMSLAFSPSLLLSYLSLPCRNPLHSFSNFRLRREQIQVFSQGLGLQSQAGQGGGTPQANVLSEGGGDPLKLRH